jgi:hypothetical protein
VTLQNSVSGEWTPILPFDSDGGEATECTERVFEYQEIDQEQAEGHHETVISFEDQVS